MRDEESPTVDDTEEIDDGEQEAGSGHPLAERLWDDQGFRERIVERCEARGVSPRSVMIEVGTSPKYHLQKANNGRNTNIVMRIAKALETHPAYLMFGLPVGIDANAPPLPVSATALSKTATTEQRLAMIAQLVSSYWMHISIDPQGARRIAELMLREIVTLAR
jgi:hypothetical protein